MYQDYTAPQIAGQALLALAFLVSGLRNAGWMFQQHVDRMAALGVPRPKWLLIAGFVLQFTGSLLLLFDVYRTLAALLLALFTIAASAIFHRWWLVRDPLLRHLHIGNLLVNIGVLGGLLLVAAL